MFEFFTENNLISDNKSGFKPGDSYVNQLLSITHEIYQPFDDNLEVRVVVVDISKAFDRYGIKFLYTNSSKMAYLVTLRILLSTS